MTATNGETKLLESSKLALANHNDYLQALVAESDIDLLTLDDIFGDADYRDRGISILCRTFATTHPSLNFKVSDVAIYLKAREKADKDMARVGAALEDGQDIPDDRHTDLYRWTSDQFEHQRIRVDCAGNVHHPRYSTADVPHALTILNAERGAAAYKPEALKSAIKIVLSDRRRDALIELRDNISGRHLTEPASTIIQRLTDMLEQGSDKSTAFDPSEVALLVCKFIWQVKRKMWDLKVTSHMMLVFCGIQGGGKSELIKAICLPVADVTTGPNLVQITDDRNIQLFNNYVATIDELDRADRTDVDSLKRVITESYVSRRPMATNMMVNVRQNLTFIGTSNRDIREAIQDETGNRRFVQVNIIGPTNERSKEFWSTVSSFDWLALWRAVDETAEDPTSPIMPKILASQKAERSLSAVEHWIQHAEENGCFCIQPGAFSTAEHLYRQFKFWEETYNPKGYSSLMKFSKEIKRMVTQEAIPFRQKRTPTNNGYVSISTNVRPDKNDR